MVVMLEKGSPPRTFASHCHIGRFQMQIRRGADAGSSVDTALPAMRVASSAKVTAEDVRQGKLVRVLAEFFVSSCSVERMGGVARRYSYATDCSCSEISHFVID